MNSITLKRLSLIFPLVICAKASAIITLAGFETDGIMNSYGPSPFSASTVDAAISSGQLLRGTGVATSGTTLDNVWGGKGFSVAGTKSGAITNDELFYLAVDFGPSLVNLSSIDYTMRRSSTAPNSFRWQFSLDATTYSDIGISDFSYNGNQTNGMVQNPISLTGIGSLQGISGLVTFRLVPFGATNTAGTLGFGRLSGDDLALRGEVLPASVPESGTTLAFLGLGIFGLILFRRFRF